MARDGQWHNDPHIVGIPGIIHGFVCQHAIHHFGFPDPLDQGMRRVEDPGCQHRTGVGTGGGQCPDLIPQAELIGWLVDVHLPSVDIDEGKVIDPVGVFLIPAPRKEKVGRFLKTKKQGVTIWHDQLEWNDSRAGRSQ